MLVQAPVVGVLYAVFLHPQIAGHGNDLLGQAFAGVPLGSSLAGFVTGGALTPGVLLVFGVLVAGIAAVGELARRAARPGGRLAPGAPTAGAAGAPVNPLAAPGMQQALGALHFLTAVIACFVPLAAGLYLLVTVWWTYAQRLVLRRRYPLPV